MPYTPGYSNIAWWSSGSVAGTFFGIEATGSNIALQLTDGILTISGSGGGGGGLSAVTILDEGIVQGSASALNFVGAGVSVGSISNGTASINILSGSGTSAGGSSGQVQYNSGNFLAGASYVNIDSTGNLNIIPLSMSLAPPIPTTGAVLFMRQKANRSMLNLVGSSGLDYPLQPFFAAQKISWMQAPGHVAGTQSFNMFLVSTGTQTAAIPNSFAFTASIRRVEYRTTALAGASCGLYGAHASWFRGGGSAGTEAGGFFFVGRVIVGLTGASGWRFMCGMQTGAAAPPNIDPSSFWNFVGVLKDAADTNYQFAHNDATSTATKTDSGIVANQGDFLEVRVYAKSSGSGGNLGISLEKLNPGASPSFTTYDSGASTDLPLDNVFMHPRMHMNNGANANIIICAPVSMYIETDN